MDQGKNFDPMLPADTMDNIMDTINPGPYRAIKDWLMLASTSIKVSGVKGITPLPFSDDTIRLDEDGNVQFCLLYYNKEKGKWERFDRNNLEEVYMKQLAVMPYDTISYGTLGDYLQWLKERRSK